MIKVVCNVKDKSLDIIDDSESTPGQSRQLSEFKHFVLLGMKRRWAKVTQDNIISEIVEVANMPVNNGFKLIKSESKNGSAIFTYEYDGE